MKILHRKDAYKSESMQLDYFQKNLFLYPTITEKQCDKVRYADTKIGGHMPNISSSELIAQFQTPLREGWGYIYGASGEIWTQTQQNAASREQTKLRGRFGSSAGTAITAATPCSAVTAAHPAACPPGNESMASRSNPALPSTNSTPRRGITTLDCTSARAKSSKPKAQRMALSRRKSAAGGRIGAS